MTEHSIAEFARATNGLAARTENRRELRYATPGKSVSILAFVEVPMKNKSESGFCIRIPRRVYVEVNQRLIINMDGNQRTAVVRWTRAADPVGSELIAGCEFIEDGQDPISPSAAFDGDTVAPE